MENEQKSWWTSFKNFIKKIMPGKKAAVTLGLAASAMAVNAEKANASEIVTVPRNNVKIVSDVSKEAKINPVDLNSSKVSVQDLQASANSRSGFDKTIDTLARVNRGLHSVNDLSNSMSNLGRSRDLGDTLNNLENVLQSAQKGEQTMSQVLSKPGVKEAKVSETKNDEIVAVKREQVKVVEEKNESEKVTIGNVNENVSTDENENNHVEPVNVEQIEITDNDVLEVDGDKYSASHVKYNPDNKEFLPSMNYINRVISRTLPSSTLTAGENISMIADARIDLIRYQNIAKQQGKMEIVEEIRKALIECDKYYIPLQEEAIKNAGAPEYDLHTPEAYPHYEPNNTTIETEIVENVEKTSDKTSIDKVELEKEKVGISQMGNFSNLDSLLDQAIAEDQQKDVTVQTPATITYHQSKIDESKLADVSIGQMGDFENLDHLLDEDVVEPQKTTHESQTSYKNLESEQSKSENVTISEMGNFKNLDTLLDEAIEEDQAKDVAVNDFNKRIKVDKHKSNENKMNFDSYKQKNTINKYIEDEER